ncbi:hypothetical protein ABFS83_01G088500 [Erythranthe nasuta]
MIRRRLSPRVPCLLLFLCAILLRYHLIMYIPFTGYVGTKLNIDDISYVCILLKRAFPKLRRRNSETFRAQCVNTKEIKSCFMLQGKKLIQYILMWHEFGEEDVVKKWSSVS